MKTTYIKPLFILFLLVSMNGYSQFKAKMVFNTMDIQRDFIVYSADDGYRYEFNENGQEGIVIVQKGSQQLIILMPQQKMAMKSSAGSPMSMGSDPLQSYEHHKAMGLLKEVGKEIVNGIECTKFELLNKENSSQKMYTVWLSDKYEFPIKMANNIDGVEGTRMELKDIQPWTPKADSFLIPKNYQVMEMGGMMR